LNFIFIAAVRTDLRPWLPSSTARSDFYDALHYSAETAVTN